MVSTKSQLGAQSYKTAFGVSGVPHLVMIGKNRIFKSAHVGWGSAVGTAIRNELREYLKEFHLYAQTPVVDQTLTPGQNKVIDLSSVFYSGHGTPTLELVENTNPGKVSATLNGTQLTLTAGLGFGFTNLKIKATAGTYTSTDDFSAEVIDANATTLANEGFEATWPPTGWTNQGWQVSTKIAHTGTKSAGAIYTHTGNIHLTSPVLNLPYGGLLEYWWRDDDIAKVTGSDSTFCEISTDGGTTWTNTAVLSADGSQSVFSKVMIDLVPFAGTNTKVRFRDWSNGSNNAWGTGVDDVKITAYSMLGINSDNVSADFSLNQNYPNPFNPTTTISFSLNAATDVKLTVYNQTGAEVSVLAESNMSKGIHSFNFDGSKLNSGVYYYTLTANNQSRTGKMLLVK